MRYDHCFFTAQSVYFPPLDLTHLTVIVADTRTTSCPNLTPSRQRAAVQSAGERSAFTQAQRPSSTPSTRHPQTRLLPQQSAPIQGLLGQLVHARPQSVSSWIEVAPPLVQSIHPDLHFALVYPHMFIALLPTTSPAPRLPGPSRPARTRRRQSSTRSYCGLSSTVQSYRLFAHEITPAVETTAGARFIKAVRAVHSHKR